MKNIRAIFACAAALALMPAPVFAVSPPSYSVTFVGPGSGSDFSDTGYVIGNNGSYVSGTSRSWVWSGSTQLELPMPAGMTGTYVKAVNNAGVIVGYVTDGTTAGARAARWVPVNASTYSVEIVAGPAGSRAFIATDVNDAGVVVGVAEMPPTAVVINGTTYLVAARNAFRSVPGGAPEALPALGDFGSTPYLYMIAAPQITNTGKVYDGVRTILHADGAVETIPPVSIGTGTYEFRGFINAPGNLAGHVSPTCSSCTTVYGVRYTRGTGWEQYPTFNSSYGVLVGFNDLGDAAWYGGQYAPGTYLHLEGVGDYPLPYLLASEFASQWALTGGSLINGNRAILTGGRNASTGQSGIVLLTPTGVALPPPAPVLSGEAHPATSQANWDSVSLKWTLGPTYPAPSGFIVERKGPGDTNFATLVQLPWHSTAYDDRAILPTTSYGYRIYAENAAGRSPASNAVTVTSPAARDTQPPAIVGISPADGSAVTLPAAFAMTATDNVGVTYSSMRVTPNMGAEQICSGGSGNLACTWSGKDPMPRLPSGTTTFAIEYFAADALGNYTSRSATYRMAASPSVDTIAPKVKFLAPANNAKVSGTFNVSTSATDEVGVKNMELRSSTGTLLCSSNSAALSCAVNASALPRGYTKLTAYAFDAAGNRGTANRTVNVR